MVFKSYGKYIFIHMDDITQCMVKRINSVIGLLFAFRDLWKECSGNTTRGGDMFKDINATMRLVRDQLLPFTTSKELWQSNNL